MTDSAEIIARAFEPLIWGKGHQRRTQASLERGKAAIAAIHDAGFEIKAVEKEPGQSCEVKWCKSGLPVAIHVNESMDDGCWSVGICQSCADALGATEGYELPDGTKVKAMIGAGK